MQKITTLKFILLLLFSMVLNAQTMFPIKGKVLNEEGIGLDNAHISIEGISKSTYTDARGNYDLGNINYNNIILIVKKQNYITYRKKYDLKKQKEKLVIKLVKKMENVEEVIYEGRLSTTSNQAKVSSSRLNVKSIDLPSSSGVVSSNLLEQQQILTLSEAVTNIAGVYQFNKGYGGVSETLGARGLSLRYLGFMFRDGNRFGTNQSMGSPDLQGVEKVEVLKGGAAINFGYISPGATVNYVMKKPQFENKGKVSLRLGSYDSYRPIVDINRKINDKLALRFVSSSEFAESFRETVKSKRIYNYGALRYKTSSKSTLDFNIDHTIDERPRDFGLPIFEDKIVVGYEMVEGNKTPIYMQKEGRQRLFSGITKDIKGKFLGSSFNKRTSSQLNSNLSFVNKFNEQWNLKLSTGMSLSSYDYQNTGSGFRNKYEKVGEDILITRTQETAEWAEDTYGMQANLNGKFNIMGMTNNMSISLDYDHRTQNSDSFENVPNFDKIFLFAKNTYERSAKKVDKYRSTETKFRGVGLSVQNLLNVTSKVNLLTSLRMDRISGSSEKTHYKDGVDLKGLIRGSTNFKKGEIILSEHEDFAFTPSVGLVYKFTDNNSVFSSYTNSFAPNTRGRMDINDDILESYHTDQFEVGTKNSFLKGMLVTNISAYIIQDKSYLSIAEKDDRYEIGPGVKYQGLEIDASVKPVKGLNMNVNYSFIDAKYGSGGSRKEGTRPQQTAKHQFGFWTRYNFSKGMLRNFSLNLGGQYTGERLGNDVFSRSKNLPFLQEAYTIINAGIAYDTKRVNLALRATNLLDEFTFMSYRTGSVNPIDPRQLSLITTFKF